jgi:hypothetical protein
MEELDRSVAAAEAEAREGARLDRMLNRARLERDVLDARIAALERAASGEAPEVVRLERGVLALVRGALRALDPRRGPERPTMAAAELELAQARSERARLDDEITDLAARAAAAAGAGARASERAAAARAAREQWLLANDEEVAGAVAECDRELARLNDEAADLVHAMRVAQAAEVGLERLLALLEERGAATLRGAGGARGQWADDARALQAADNAGRLVRAALLELDDRRRGLETEVADVRATRLRILGR